MACAPYVRIDFTQSGHGSGTVYITDLDNLDVPAVDLGSIGTSLKNAIEAITDVTVTSAVLVDTSQSNV